MKNQYFQFVMVAAFVISTALLISMLAHIQPIQTDTAHSKIKIKIRQINAITKVVDQQHVQM